MHECGNAKGQIGILTANTLYCLPSFELCLLIMSSHACLCAHICLIMSAYIFINTVCVLHPAGYELWWEVPGIETSREERSLSNSTLLYQLTGLTSTTMYRVQVAALTAAGRGTATSSAISTGVPPGITNICADTHKPL